MKSSLRLALIAASIYFSFLGSAAAYYCNQPSDIGMAAYQVQSVTTIEEGNKFDVELLLAHFRCTESYGQYRWEPHYPLNPVSRRAADGSIYTMNVILGEAVLTSEAYEVISTDVLVNHHVQKIVYHFKTRDLFKTSPFLRFRFFLRIAYEINHGGKIIRPTPVASGETFIDIKSSLR